MCNGHVSTDDIDIYKENKCGMSMCKTFSLFIGGAL